MKIFYLGKKAVEVDNRLTSISPPSEITRAPRSIKERKFWKASEWRAFMLYGLVVLKGLLPRVYLQHFFLFVYVCTISLATKLPMACLKFKDMLG